MTDRMIGWEKWEDPYGADMLEANWPGTFDEIEEKDDSDDMYYEDGGDILEEEYTEEQIAIAAIKRKPVKILSTPMGIIPITEYNATSANFNLWTGHTNFRITKKVKDILDDTDGVETLDVFTPYRFRIAIGKLFNTQEVKQNVMRNLDAKSAE